MAVDSNFLKSSAHKNLKLAFSGGDVLTNPDIYFESLEITESICSEKSLRFGNCEASMFKITIANTGKSYAGQTVTVSVTFDDDTTNVYYIGKYKVDSDKPTGDRNMRELVGYDALKDILGANVADWYNSVFATSPRITVKSFRDKFFGYFNLPQIATSLINDDFSLTKTVEPSELSGARVLNAILELNGVFGHINNVGNFEYISLNSMGDALYPSLTLYPQVALYPRVGGGGHEIETAYYQSCTYEDFVTEEISKLQIRQENRDIGVVVGTGDNCYVIEDNFLVYGETDSNLKIIANRVFEKIKGIAYRPATIKCVGNPTIKIGTALTIVTSEQAVQTYALQRVLSGIQMLTDEFKADGSQRYEINQNSTQREIVQLRGKTNILIRDVEKTQARIEDVQSGLSSQIEQTASSIRTEITASKVDGSNILMNSGKYSEESRLTAQNIGNEYAAVNPTDMYARVIPGKTYVVQCRSTVSWTDIAIMGMANWIILTYTDENGGTISVHAVGDDERIDDGAQPSYGAWRFQVPYDEEIRKATVSFACLDRNEYQFVFQYWYAKIEEGMNATAWSIPPEYFTTFAEDIRTQINQTAEQIQLKASKDDLISEINLSADRALIKAEKIDLVGLVNANEMVAKYATISSLDAQKARIDNLETDKLSAYQASLLFATISSLDAVNARVQNLAVEKLDVGTANAKFATVESLSALNASVQSLSANKIDASTVKANYMEVANWTSNGYIKANKIDANTINAKISSLKTLLVDGRGYSLKTINYVDHNGAKRSMNVLGTVQEA